MPKYITKHEFVDDYPYIQYTDEPNKAPVESTADDQDADDNAKTLPNIDKIDKPVIFDSETEPQIEQDEAEQDEAEQSEE